MATFMEATPNRVGARWYNQANEEVAYVIYRGDQSTFNVPFDFELNVMGGCTNPVLTIDLRTACKDGVRTLFDLPTGENPIPGQTSTTGSAEGKLEIDGGCSNVPATYEYAVGIEDADPVGDLYCVLTLDLSSCTLDQVQIRADTDTTEFREDECSINAHGDPHIKVRGFGDTMFLFVLVFIRRRIIY